MQHARDITDKAVDLTAKELAQKGATQSGANPDRNAIRQHFAFIESMFEPFSRLPDPVRYDPLIADLNAAMAKLNTGSVNNTELSNDVSFVNPHLDKMTTDGGYLQGWTGDAAMAFKANFVDTFKSISGNQFTVLSTLKGILQAHREMWLRARADIDKIAENTKNALDNAGGCGKNQWTFEFSVLSAVSAIGGVVVAIATGGVVPLAAIGALASVGGAGVAGLTASGDSAETIVNSMRQAVDELLRHIQEVETQQIAQKVRALTDAVNANKDKIVAARPNLAGMKDRDLTGDSGMGRSD
ncbi:hypothetical protein [Amycolatopsis sp. SID8362]|uniref:hypothetical protein n=1 Tax=Amycolatopsis sp. SID8362 TaxID=2690346 RepID=UPI0013685D0F|nr:hypothetical protein [Amycolatopsis sp. SID8362]NBH11311.1 hypothetical protein [Amycolatopsis sp. SID8362]NED48003.1 hypothetical protein [Amycolatopsis sp. SID8362]